MNRHRYDDDFAAWTDEQASLLRAGELSGLDLDNLAEEIESLGNSQRRELGSRLVMLIQHLLKWRFQPEHRSRSWRATIRVQRRDIETLLTSSPSLRPRMAQLLDDAYPGARDAALDETGLLSLPDACPFAVEEVTNLEWFPD